MAPSSKRAPANPDENRGYKEKKKEVGETVGESEKESDLI